MGIRVCRKLGGGEVLKWGPANGRHGEGLKPGPEEASPLRERQEAAGPRRTWKIRFLLGEKELMSDHLKWSGCPRNWSLGLLGA